MTRDDVPMTEFEAPVSDAWRQHAACLGMKTELWEGVRTKSHKYAPADFTLAKSICDRCSVQYLCLADALAEGRTEIMRGGLKPNELRAILAAGRQAEKAAAV